MSEDFQKSAASMAAATAPGAGMPQPGPDTKSADYKMMQPLWEKVGAIEGGVDRMRTVEKFLPRFELESDADYKTRRETSPFTNIYEDISGSLASKPFSREVQFEDHDDVDPDFIELYDNIDGQGNNLHVFSETLFQGAVDHGVDWILIEFTRLPALPEGRTARSVAEEQKLGARPYWVHICGPRVFAAYTAMVKGDEILTHVRIGEPTLVRTAYAEEIRERVRIFEREEYKDENGQCAYYPANWRVEEKKTDVNGKVTWEIVDSGSVPIEIIPMVPFRTGKRIGNGQAVKAPLGKLVDMQLDAFQQESNLRNIELLTSYPMLTGSGVAPPSAPDPSKVAAGPMANRLTVGPRAVLYAPPNLNGGRPGSWAFIEPSGENVKVLSGELDKTWGNMREIGMQPMAESNITVITSANVSVKAKSALQAWALRLRDALEQAFEVTALWMNKPPESAPGVDVYKDFGVDLQSGKELETLETMAKDNFLSGETLRAEAKRRNVLGDSFNESEEQKRLADQASGSADNEQEIDPATGQPLGEPSGPSGEPVDSGGFSSADQIDEKTMSALGI